MRGKLILSPSLSYHGFAFNCSLVTQEPERQDLTQVWQIKVSSLHCCLTFYLPEKFLSSLLSFSSSIPHTYTFILPSMWVHLLSSCPSASQNGASDKGRCKLSQWSESNGKRRRRVAEEKRSDGCQGDVGDRVGGVVAWWREAWGARCEFFLTGWSLLWADPLPAGNCVSWKCAGVR